ncbi:MAG: hypothetical protein ACRCR1_04735 [Aeromonas sp.]
MKNLSLVLPIFISFPLLAHTAPSSLSLYDDTAIATLSLQKEQGIADTALAAILAQQNPDPSSFSLLKQYVIGSGDVIYAKAAGSSPNNLYNCGNFNCLTVTVNNGALKHIMKMDFISSQPYAMLNNFKILHDGITVPTDPIVDITKQDNSYTFYFPSTFGFMESSATFIPVNGRDQ